MSYATLIEKEGITANYLAVLSPRRIVDSWTLDSGSVYYNDFTLGYVSGVSADGMALSAGASSALSANEFFWDNELRRLYVRTSAGPDNDIVVVTYEIHVSTFDAHWNRSPLDSASTVVYFDPLISVAPQITQTVSELFFGILPTRSTRLVLNNADKVLNKHLSNSSFSKADLSVYHWLGELSADNIKKVLVGQLENHDWDDKTVSFKVNDAVSVFDTEFRVDQTVKNYSTDDYASLDPFFNGALVRYVYGVVDGLSVINADYNTDAPTTSNNRVYKVCGEGGTLYQKTGTVPASPSSTTTRTYVDSAQGFLVGDTVRLDKSTDESRTITAVDYVNNYIEHAALSSGASATGNTVIRYPIARVEIFQNEVKYLAQVVRDFTSTVDANGILTLTFNSSVESNLSMPDTISPGTNIAVRVYGKQNNVELSSVGVGSNDSESGVLQSAGVILIDLLKRYAGISESEINISAFQTLVSDATDRLGFSISDNANARAPSLKQVISEICKSALISIYKDIDLKWSASRLKVLSAPVKTIEDDEILVGSLNYDFSYSDLYTEVKVDYARREVSEGGEIASSKTVSSTSARAEYLHNLTRTLEETSLHYSTADAQVLADRLLAIYSDRQGVITLNAKNRFFETEIDKTVRIKQESLPGFDFTSGTSQQIDLNLRESNKGLRRVELVLNDLKGVSDNSEDF